jgi:Right handed beta helix region
MKRLLLIVAFLLIAAPAWATTYYTSQSGDNGNGLSLAHAKTTIAAGLALLSASDTLLIDDGTYAETIVNAVPSGSTGNPTIIKAINNRQVIVLPSSGVYALQITPGSGTVDYITFDGLVFDGTNLSESVVYLASDTMGGEIHDIIFQHCTVRNSVALETDPVGRGYGLILGHHNNHAGHYDNQILDCDFADNIGFGFYLIGHDNIVDGNRFNHNGEYGFAHYTTSETGVDNNIVRNNVISNNGWNTLAAQAALNGALLSGGTGLLFYNNIIYGNGDNGLRISNGLDTSGIYDNTIYGNGSYGIHIWAASGGQPTNITVENNIIFGNVDGSLNDEGSGTVADHNLTSDPLFVNSAGADFHLLSGSSALGAGVAIGGITTDFDGVTRPNPPSIGAYEVPSGSNPNSPLSEPFDEYSAATSIDGLNLGDGFTQSWELRAGAATVETAPAWMSGKSLRINAADGQDEARRLLTALSGSFSITAKMSLSITNPNAHAGFSLLDQAGGYQSNVAFGPSNDISALGTSLLAGYTVDHSYLVEVNFDTDGHPNQFRVKLDGGSYSSWLDSVAPFTAIAGIEPASYASNAHTFWFDDIGTSSGCVPDHLEFINQPSGAPLGSNIGFVRVGVFDSGNNSCASDTSTITLAKTGGTCTGMTLNGTVSGANQFSTSNINMTGSTGACSLTATDGMLTSADSDTFTITPALPGGGIGTRLRLNVR